MNMTDIDYIFKILIIGDSSVGKSNLLLRFSDNIFNETFLPTIGVDFKIRNVTVGDKGIKLYIWDTAGQERFKTITAPYYKGAHGTILVFDLTDRYTFKNITSWISEVRKHGGPNVVKLLVGNKCDLESDRKVTYREAKKFADSNGMTYLETSAKARINVDEAFMALTKQVYESLFESEEKSTDQGKDLKPYRKSANNSGCHK